MIDFYTWTTPNGRKISIALEEMEIEYRCFPINLSKKENYSKEYERINPDHSIPVIVDQESGLTLKESGAILLYLAEKTQKLIPSNLTVRWSVIQWLMWQMSGLGPSFGQMHHFVKHNPGVSSYGTERFVDASKRMYSTLDGRLSNSEYVAGDYSIADIAIWPWVARYEWHPVSLHDYPNILRWYLDIANREAVQRGYRIPDETLKIPLPNT